MICAQSQPRGAHGEREAGAEPGKRNAALPVLSVSGPFHQRHRQERRDRRRGNERGKEYREIGEIAHREMVTR